jgi:hypothetical protein
MRTQSIAPLLLAASGALVSLPTLAEQELFTDSDGTTKILFNVDLIGAAYQSQNSWFGESASLIGEDTDAWADFGVEPQITLEMPMGEGTFFGAISGVYTSTYGTDASLVGAGLDDTSEATLEQGHIGWRAEDFFEGIEGDTFTLTLGKQDYNIGTGLLMNDGGGDGGERGGWYLGMRKTFSEALIASLKTDKWLAEGFTLKNRPRAGGTQGEAYGTNVEYTYGEMVTFGGTYMNVDPNTTGSVDADVFSARVDWRTMGGFGISGEYVDESSSQIDANGFYGQVSYELMDTRWSPVLSYRYAHFDGDNPATAIDERFREIAYGYTDWGFWYQGEITGEYALGNGNLESQMLRAKVQPKEGVTVNFFYYNFTLDQPGDPGFGVTSDDWGDEVNFTVEWEASDNLYIIGVIGALFPGDGAEQYVGATPGSTDDWLHAMLYMMYSW